MEHLIKEPEKIEISFKEKVTKIVIDVIFAILSLMFIRGVYIETGFYTALLASIIAIQLWYKKEVLTIAYYMMRKISKQKLIKKENDR